MRFLIPLIVMATSTIATADSFSDEVQHWLGFVNQDCGSSIRLEGPVKKVDNFQLGNCAGAFDQLRRYCKQDNGKPHPAGQEFVKQNIKVFSCKAGPDADKPVVSISIRNGVFALQTTPGFGAQGIEEAMRADRTLSKIWPKRRVWDLENVDLPESSKWLKEACGADVAMTIDVPSWQARGKLLDYPDTGAADVCANYAAGLVKACKQDKAKARAQVSGIRCSLLPATQENDPPQIRIVGKQIQVHIGTLGSNQIDSGGEVYRVLTGK